MSSVDDTTLGVSSFSSLQTGSLENLCSVLGCETEEPMGNAEKSTYLELIQARHHYFSSAAAAAAQSTSEELTSILQEFHENYRLSNGVSSTHELKSEVSAVDNDTLEEIELPPGDVADCNIGHDHYGNALQVDNFVGDESHCPLRGGQKTGGRCGDESSDEENDLYVPSFGIAPLSLISSAEVSYSGESVALSGGLNCSLEEMCDLLVEESDSDVESVTDTFKSQSSVRLNIPISNMDLKLTGERMIRSDADLFLEHYIGHMDSGAIQMESEHNSSAQSGRYASGELVIDTVNEENFEEDGEIYSEENDYVAGMDATFHAAETTGDIDVDDIPLRAKAIIEEHFRSNHADLCCLDGANDRSYDDIECFDGDS